MRVRRLVNILVPVSRNLGFFQMKSDCPRLAAREHLPHLIFGDNHTVGIEQETLVELAPVLKEMGYTRVMLEFSSSEGWKEIEKYIETEQAYFNELAEDFTKANLDITNPKDIELFLKNYVAVEVRKIDDKYHNGEISGLDRLYEHDEVMTRATSARKTIQYNSDTEALKKFVATYKALGFKCSNIDSDTEVTAASSAEEILQTMDTRSEDMAQAIISAEYKREPSITILGLRHLQHIQEKLVEKFGADVARERYKFINITIASNEISAFEKRVLTGKIKFPLGLYQIHSNLHQAIKDIIVEGSAAKPVTPKISESTSNNIRHMVLGHQ